MAGSDPRHVFINAPFDAAYEPLFVTLVGTLVFLGQQPHCVLEVPEKGDGRLQRILDLIRTCRTSVHELSRVGTPVRFNMPFELGLACALKLENPAAYEVFVLDCRLPSRQNSQRLQRPRSVDPSREVQRHGRVSTLIISSRCCEYPAEFRRAVRLLQEIGELHQGRPESHVSVPPFTLPASGRYSNRNRNRRGFIKP